jgi:hypothetical protein
LRHSVKQQDLGSGGDHRVTVRPCMTHPIPHEAGTRLGRAPADGDCDEFHSGWQGLPGVPDRYTRPRQRMPSWPAEPGPPPGTPSGAGRRVAWDQNRHRDDSDLLPVTVDHAAPSAGLSESS